MWMTQWWFHTSPHLPSSEAFRFKCVNPVSVSKSQPLSPALTPPSLRSLSPHTGTHATISHPLFSLPVSCLQFSLLKSSGSVFWETNRLSLEVLYVTFTFPIFPNLSNKPSQSVFNQTLQPHLPATFLLEFTLFSQHVAFLHTLEHCTFSCLCSEQPSPPPGFFLSSFFSVSPSFYPPPSLFPSLIFYCTTSHSKNYWLKTTTIL